MNVKFKAGLAAVMAISMAMADGLPEGYTQLPFVKASGQCRVRTGLLPAGTDKAELTFELSTVSGNQNLWCSRSGSTGQFTTFMIADKVRFDRNATQTSTSGALVAAKKYTVTADYATGAGVVTDVAAGTTAASVEMDTDEYTPASELCLFASHTTDVETGLDNYGSWTFYSFKLRDADGNLRCDLVPARLNSDGVIGLYDTVRSTFLSNDLDGELTLGTGYSFDDNGNLLVAISVVAQGNGAIRVGEGEAAATASTTARQDRSETITVTAVPDDGFRFYRWVLPEGAELTQGELTSATISFSANRPGTVRAAFYSTTAEVFAKFLNGAFHYYADAMCAPESELPPGEAPSSIAGVKVVFANDAEYQALVPHAEELAIALGGMAHLQNDITLTADADWRAMDFNLNGKVITLMGWDLYVHKPQGTGRITSGNVLNPDGYSFGSSASYYDGNWLYLGNSGGAVSAKQSFSLPKARPCYFKTQTLYRSTGYWQAVSVGINSVNNLMGQSPHLSGTQTWGPYTRSGLEAGTSYELRIARYNGKTRMSKFATLSPMSILCFDIPEGEEHDPSNITFGGSTPGTSDYGGLGLQIHKMGKGKLVMSTAKGDIGGSGVTSTVVEEGVLEIANNTGCGATNSRIEVLEGGQFDTLGASSAAYDFTISGSGVDGLGAIVNNTEVADVFNASFIARNIALGTNAVIGGTHEFNLKNGNWAATTMTMGGHSITYTNTTVYAGNVTYSGAGSIIVPQGATLSFYAHNSAAANCNVTVSGTLNLDCGGFTSVGSLVFEPGSACILSDAAGSGSIPTTVVMERFAPCANYSNGGECTLTSPVVQLGDASHLEPTLDLSRIEGVFDGTNTTFYSGSTVTVDLGDREFSGSVLLVAWSELSTAVFVVDDANKERLGLLPRPDGLYIFPGKVPSFVKYDVEHDHWAFYDEDVNLFNGEWTLGMDYMKALFATDGEFQALAQHKDEIDAANVSVFLQDDITLNADADWRAIDFDMNGKTIYLMGWNLQVHKPQGVGRITAGNLISNGGFEDGSTGWAFGGSSGTITASGSGVTANTCKDKPFVGNHWCVIGTANDTAGATTLFTVSHAGTHYVRFRYAKYDSNYAEYGVNCGIDGVNNIVKHLNVKPYPQGNSSPIYKRTLTAGTHSFIFGRYYAYILVDEAAVSPESHLTFDIPEGEECDISNIVLGSTQNYFFDGIGLQLHKTGKGTLVMSKANNHFGGDGTTSMVVKDGLVKKASGATCGEQYSRIVVEDGAQFDLNGRTYHDYSYTLSGTGSDGRGALISTAEIDAATAYAQNTGMAFLRNVTLGADTTIYAAGNMGMIFYNYDANTMTMGGNTVTYDGTGETRIFAGNMSYSGEGKIVIATNGWFQTHISSPTAGGCAVDVYGRYWQNTGNLTPVKSLVFHEGSKFRELNASPATKVVYETYAPPVVSESEEGFLTQPKVQLGAADHLEVTLDLSRFTDTYDDREEGALSFYFKAEEVPASDSGTGDSEADGDEEPQDPPPPQVVVTEATSVTIEIGDRTEGFGKPALLWKEAPPYEVMSRFRSSATMKRRGMFIEVRDDGIYFVTGLTLFIR